MDGLSSAGPELSRRQFVVLATGCAAACACGLASAATTAPSPSSAGPVDVGTLADYPQDVINDHFAAAHKMFVIREGNEIHACSSICTHRGFPLQARNKVELYCSKHGSVFSPEGTVTTGPAKSSLVRYAIHVDEHGHIMVDPTKSFREKMWSDPASFITVT